MLRWLHRDCRRREEDLQFALKISEARYTRLMNILIKKARRKNA